MSANTKIEWADHTFNPWEGCQKIGPGCDHCYAETRNARFAGGTAINWGPGAPRRRTSASNWQQPLKWNREAAAKGIRYRVFCASLADVFDNAVPDTWRWDLFRLIDKTPHLDWLLLTKRIGNARNMLNEAASCVMGDFVGKDAWDMQPWPNVWLGATIVNQEEADRDIPKLLAIPAAKRLLSMEPLLNPVDLTKLHNPGPLHQSGAFINALRGGTWGEVPSTGERLRITHGPLWPIDWVIVGGESGPNSRPMHPDWARSLRDQCQEAGVPYLFKQWGEWGPYPTTMTKDQRRASSQPYALDEVMGLWKCGKKTAGRLLDGRTWDGLPA